jgi:N-methylhydantoinase A
VIGVGQMPKIANLVAPQGTTFAKARVRSGQCVFRVDGQLRSFDTAFYHRHLLPVGEGFAGPAVVLQKDSTTVIPPGCDAINDRAGNLILTIAGETDARR